MIARLYNIVNPWKDMSKKNPPSDGWYMCTVEVKNQQRYTMELFWRSSCNKFIDNRRQTIFEDYSVYDYNGNHMSTCDLCDRTNSVVAWRKRIDNPYMNGFVEK